MDGAHDAGTGENAHLWADELRRAVDLEDDTGRPLVLEVAAPLHPANQRLMDTLGVEVRVVTPIARQESRELVARTEGNYVVPAAASANGNGHGPRTDWIDYRASVARVHKREQAGDEALVCPGCGTETDVSDVVHSPRCEHIASPPARPSDWDHDSIVAALRTHARDGVAPTGSSWYTKADDRPTYAIVCRVFGTWGAAVEAAELERPPSGPQRRTSKRQETPAAAAEPGSDVEADEPTTSDGEVPEPAETEAALFAARKKRRKPYTRDEVEIAYRQFFDEHGRPPGHVDFKTCAYLPSPLSAARAFDVATHSDLIEALGWPRPTKATRYSEEAVTRRVPRGAKWTREQLIERLQDWAAAHDGNAPTSYDWRLATEDWPTTDNVMKLFGSWRAGVEAAGLRIRRRSSEELGHQEPPVVWAVKVPGTGLRYRTADEALVAADEIEHDGERVARQARVDGQDGKADQAIDASRELAQKIREAAGQDSREPAVPPSAVPARERPVTSQQPTLSDGEIAVVAAVRDLDPLTLTGEQTAGWIARLEAESERLHRRAQAFDTIAEGLRQLQETDV